MSIVIDAPTRMHRNTCYAKSNLSPPDPVRLIIKPFFGVIQGPRWTVVMCLQRLSLAPISYKYPVPARLRGVSRFPFPLPTILLPSTRFLDLPLCLTLTLLPNRPTSDRFSMMR